MHGRLQVTIVTGTSAGLAGLLCARMCALGIPVVRYRQDGNLLFRSHGGERAVVHAGQCANRALCAEVTDFLTGLPGGPLLLVLPETADPLRIALAADAEGITIQTVAMLADLGSVARELAGGESLAERGLAAGPADSRSLAGLLARQAETADVFLTWTPPHADPSHAAPGLALLAHLSPRARFLDLDAASDLAGTDKPRFDPQAVLERTEPGGALPPCPDPFAGVATLIWRSRRPLHPERLHAALGQVMGSGVCRARGCLWLASRPRTLLSWQIAGQAIAIEPAGRWLHGAGPDAWRQASPIRRTAAALDWHPEHGDRRSEIRFTGTDLLSHQLCTALGHAVLTGPEMAAGEQAWARLADPFTHRPTPSPRDGHPAGGPPRPIGER